MHDSCIWLSVMKYNRIRNSFESLEDCHVMKLDHSESYCGSIINGTQHMTLDFSHQQHNTTKWIRQRVHVWMRLLEEGEKTTVRSLT